MIIQCERVEKDEYPFLSQPQTDSIDSMQRIAIVARSMRIFHLFCCRKSCGTSRTSLFMWTFKNCMRLHRGWQWPAHTAHYYTIRECDKRPMWNKLEMKSFSSSFGPTFLSSQGMSEAQPKDGFTSLSSINAVLQVLNYLLVDRFPWGTREKTVTNSLKSVCWPHRFGAAA